MKGPEHASLFEKKALDSGTVFNLGMGEITIIVLLALIILGPKKLPELASGLGKLIREIRKTTSDVKNEIQLDDAIRKPLEELREAVTLHPEELKRRDKLKRELLETAAKIEEMTAAQEAAQKAVDEAAKDVAQIAENLASTDGNGASGSADPDATIADAQASLPPGVSPPPVVSAPPVAPPFVAPPPIPPAGTVSRATSPGLPASFQRPLGPANASLFGPVPSGRAAEPPVGAADRANTTQILSEADLSAIAASPPPPPPAARATGRAHPAVAPRLPGATPPKSPSPEPPANPEDKKSENTG